MPQSLVVVARQQLTARVVALVTAVRQDALLQVRRIRTVQQHLLVVVGLYHQVVGRADSLLDLIVGRAAVGNQHKPLAHVVDAVTQAVGRVVRDTESVDLHAEQLEGYALVEEPACGLQLQRHSVVAVDACMDLFRRVNRQVDMLAQTTHRTDMVRVIVRHQHTHDVRKIQVHAPQAVVDLTRRDAGIDQDALLLRAQVVAIARATRTETAKYEMLFRHTKPNYTKSGAKLLLFFELCK